MSEDIELLILDDEPLETEEELEAPEDTPTGALVQPPPGFEDTNLKWMKWGPLVVAYGPGIGPHFLTDLAYRRRENMGIVCVIYGPPGSGKTFFGLTTAMALDPNFDVEKQVLFKREQIMNIISKRTPVKPGQALIIDESQFSISARTWGNSQQVELMQHLAALRSRNFILFIIVLGPDMLDKIVREFQITHKIFMKRRGLGQVQTIEQGPKYTYDRNLSKDCYLPLPNSWPECEDDMLKTPPQGCLEPSCLRCHWCGLVDGLWDKREKWDELGFTPCRRGRAKYERAKAIFLESEADRVIQSDKPRVRLTEEARRLAISNRITEIVLTDKNHLGVESMRDAVEKETMIRPSEKETMKDREWYENTFPEKIKAMRESKILDRETKKAAAKEVKRN